MKSLDALVVGAGAAGLAAMTRLAHHIGVESIRAVDKSWRAGGRLATRERTADGVITRCDHGAQFFTTRSTRFADLVRRWVESGLVVEWHRGLGTGESHPRYVARQGMNSLARDLAAGLPVRCGWTARSIALTPRGWAVTSTEGETVETRALVLTPPAPQAAALLETANLDFGDGMRDRLRRITYEPCLAAMAWLLRPSRIPPPGGLAIDDGPIRWMADNQQKGISPGGCVVTIHGSGSFSRTWIDGDRDEAGRWLVKAARKWLGSDPVEVSVHGWRYSMPVHIDEDRAPALWHDPPLVLCGDGFDGPRVEGAFLSGWTAGERVAAWVG